MYVIVCKFHINNKCFKRKHKAEKLASGEHLERKVMGKGCNFEKQVGYLEIFRV